MVPRGGITPDVLHRAGRHFRLTQANSDRRAFYNAVVTTRRASHERARWLLAVLIVITIAAASVAIVRWPLPLPPAVPPSAAIAADFVDSPRVRVLAPVTAVSQRVRSSRAPDSTAQMSLVADVVSDPPPAESTAAAVSTPIASTPTVPPLASWRVPVVALVPVRAGDELPMPALAIASPHGLVEIPAVAVTRVVTIAGRGLWTGVRATTAALMAAF